jgi:hypothetical protein
MPFFRTPDVPSSQIGTVSPSEHSYPLFKFYGQIQSGTTVWRDSNGIYHHNEYPYLGNHTSTVHNDTVTTTTPPDEGLLTATEVYYGGNTYEITQQTADDLTAAGYGAYITP